jgi:hypothetical protein
LNFTHPLKGGGYDRKKVWGSEMMYLKAAEQSDFVNHVFSDDQSKEPRRHQRTRRNRCAETAALLKRVAVAGALEANYQPPAERVRVVKAAFAVAGLAVKRRKTGLMQLLYDSFSQPALAGIRSGATRIRQMLYRAEPYQIDLQIELQQEQNRFVVTGQLVDLSHPEMVGRDVQVMLSDGRKYMVNTVTNQFGEFRGEVENSGDLEISFLGRGDKPIVILLRSPLDCLSAGKE